MNISVYHFIPVLLLIITYYAYNSFKSIYPDDMKKHPVNAFRRKVKFAAFGVADIVFVLAAAYFESKWTGIARLLTSVFGCLHSIASISGAVIGLFHVIDVAYCIVCLFTRPDKKEERGPAPASVRQPIKEYLLRMSASICVILVGLYCALNFLLVYYSF